MGSEATKAIKICVIKDEIRQLLAGWVSDPLPVDVDKLKQRVTDDYHWELWKIGKTSVQFSVDTPEVIVGMNQPFKKSLDDAKATVRMVIGIIDFVSVTDKQVKLN